MVAREALRLADLVEESLGIERDGDAAQQQETRRAGDAAELSGVSAELSALLVELARTPEEAVDVASGWTPGLSPGDAVGRFVLRREIGRGGFGVVYEALDRELGRVVAFKALRPGRRLAGRSTEWLRAEAEAVAKLNHPNIVTLHDFGRGPSGPYLIFELLRGETLADRLRAGRLPLREAVAVATDVARVLDHAHRAGVVHRDLKPANVFLCEDGAVKVLDFGLANLFGRAGAISGGTPSYMAPEQWREERGDGRTDLFALGVLLFQMLTGRVPYRATRDAGEVNEPGPPPQLPKDAAPAPLRRLTAQLLERDPADRPQRAREVLDALAAVSDHMDGKAVRRRVAWAALAAAAAVAVVAALLDARRQLPADGERLVVAVADFENGTGDRELDGLSGLLVTSLEQSRRFQVLTRSRLLALVRQAGKPDTARLDAALARELARGAGARVLLAGTARRSGDVYALELEALDPFAEREIFSVRETAPAKAELFGAVDRLSDAVRARLREREPEARATRIRVARALTEDVGAYQAYFDGVDCVDRPSRTSWTMRYEVCAEHFRAALARDPTFAQAHYQLGLLVSGEQGPRPEVEAHLAAAIRYVERVPPKDAALIRAWEAHVLGHDDEALRLYGEVLAAFPEDAQALFLSGDFQFHRSQWAAAVPFLERTLAVRPGAELALEHLVDALGILQRREELLRLRGRLEAEPESPAGLHARMRALLWTGDPDGAVALARAAVEKGFGPAAVHDLAVALAAKGSYAEVEALMRERLAQAPADDEAPMRLAASLRAQGRRREGLRVVEALAARPGTPYGPQLRAYYLAGDGDARAVWREAAKGSVLQPENEGLYAVLVAIAGDLRRAGELAATVPERSTAREEYDALARWREGDGARAAAQLSALDQRDPWPEPAMGLAPSYLLAEVAAASGDPREAAAAAERFLALPPRGLWRGWAYPRALYLSALARERLGERDAARSQLERLLALLSGADADLPLLAQARALQARIAR